MVTGLLESHGLIQPAGRAPSWRAIVAGGSSINARSLAFRRMPPSSPVVRPSGQVSSAPALPPRYHPAMPIAHAGSRALLGLTLLALTLAPGAAHARGSQASPTRPGSRT